MKRVLAAALLAVALMTAQALAADRFDPGSVRGPCIDRLCMLIITNPDSQLLAAENGDVDIVSDITRPSDVDVLSRSPRFTMSLARGFHAFFLILNNKAFPWNDKSAREAAALAIDRSGIVRNIFSGYCEPISTWLPPVSPWALSGGVRNIYDRAAARAKLKKLGYTWNISGFLVAPDGRPLKKMKLLAPLARLAPTTAELAEQISDSLRAIGFPVDVEPMDFSAMISKLDRKDYSLAVMAWSMGRNPDSLYSFYHSSMDIPGGYNMTGTRDKELDAALDALKSAKDRAAAEAASRLSQSLLARLMPSVPIYSRFSVSAVSKKWKNIVMTERMTADNIWTLLMAKPVDGKTRQLNMLLSEEPRSFNPFTASSAYSWQVLGMIYEGMLDTDPFTLSDIPGIAMSWNVSTVGGGKAAHTVLRFTIKNGLRWNDGSILTARDIASTLDFLRKNKIPRFYDAVKDIVSVSVSGNELTVSMRGVSYWYLDNVGGLPCMPERTLKAVKSWQNWNPVRRGDKAGPFGLVGTGPFMFEEYRPGEYVMMKKNPFYRRLAGAGAR